jgi:peptidoglycan/xylan/chitin deacetylase (PgdA/CDA1 family)
VRSHLSGSVRGWVTRVNGPLGVAQARAVCALATLAVLSAAVIATGCGDSRAAAPASPRADPAHVRADAPKAKELFRVVGCQSGGGPFRGGPRRREVAIGFDDGPSRETGAFVRMLEHTRAQATFFVIGRLASGVYRAEMLRELRDGDAIGDHTFTHPALTLAPNVHGQLLWTLGAVRAQTGYTPCVFRPPYGAYDRHVVSAARRLGLATVLWNVDPSDYSKPGVQAIVRRVLSAVRPGSIIISHDGGGGRRETLLAYERIIPALRARGYRLVTIPALLGFVPVYARCASPCDGLGVSATALPAGARISRVAAPPSS